MYGVVRMRVCECVLIKVTISIIGPNDYSGGPTKIRTVLKLL